MAFSSFGGGGGGGKQADLELAQCPSATVSSLSWNPAGNVLAASSWDASVSCWEVAANGQTQPRARTTHDAPILCSTFSSDGSGVFFGSCSNKAMLWNLQSNQTTQIGAHGAPIRCIARVHANIMTGGWDNCAKVWDGRSPNATCSLALPQKVFCMDAIFPVAIFGCAERHIVTYDLRKPDTPLQATMSPLKFQTRSIGCFVEQDGYAVGSVEGRIGISYFNAQGNQSDFTYRAHRHKQNDQEQIFAVNAIAFNRVGTFATMGSDGQCLFWDKDNRQKIATLDRRKAPISCGQFNESASMFAYASSYDWSQGPPQQKEAHNYHHIFIHGCTQADINKRPKTR